MSSRKIKRQWRRTRAKRQLIHSHYVYLTSHLPPKYTSTASIALTVAIAFYSGYRTGKLQPDRVIKKYALKQAIQLAIPKQ